MKFPENIFQLKEEHRIIALPALLLIVLTVYSTSVFNGFVFDDLAFIANNQQLKDPGNFTAILTSGDAFGTGGVNPYYRPLTTLSFYLNSQMGDGSALLYHLTNLLIHLATTALLYLVAKKFYGGVCASAAALLFGVHPVNVEAVVYISARADLLSALLTLASFYYFLLYDEADRRRHLAISLALYFLASTAKITSLMLPAALFCYSALNRNLRTRLAAISSYAVPAVAFIALKGAITGHEVWYEFDLVTNLATGGVNIATSALTSLFPVFHKVLYGRETYTSLLDSTAITGWLFVGFLLLAAFRLANTLKITSLGILWYLIMLFPASGIPTLLYPSFVADRYMYLPIVGFALAAGDILRRFEAAPERGRAAFGALAAIILVFSVTTHNRAQVWQDDLTYWRKASSDQPTDPFVLGGLAFASLERGLKEEAIHAFRLSALNGDVKPRNLSNLATLLAEQGDFPQAKVFSEQALEYGARDWVVHHNHSNILQSLGDHDGSRRHSRISQALQANSTEQVSRLEKVEEYVFEGEN